MDETKPACSFCGKVSRPLIEGRHGAFICHGCAAFTHQIAANEADRAHRGRRRRSLLRFGIRDLLWAMVVVGLAVGWWADNLAARREHEYANAVHKAEMRRARATEQWSGTHHPEWERSIQYSAPAGFIGD